MYLLEDSVPNLKQKILVPGAGQWVQQERPQEVNDLIIEFLKGVKKKGEIDGLYYANPGSIQATHGTGV